MGSLRKKRWLSPGFPQSGAELARISWPGGPVPTVNEDFYFPFEVAFREPEICDCEPVIPTLHQMLQLVEHIVGVLAP